MLYCNPSLSDLVMVLFALFSTSLAMAGMM